MIGGYIDPIGLGMGFMIPVITVEGTNARYIQKQLGRLMELKLEPFNIEDVKEFHELPELYEIDESIDCLLYTSPSPRDGLLSRMPSSA